MVVRVRIVIPGTSKFFLDCLVCESVVAGGLKNKHRDNKVHGHIIAAVVISYMCMGKLKCLASMVKEEEMGFVRESKDRE